jgi:hypothetical protein
LSPGVADLVATGNGQRNGHASLLNGGFGELTLIVAEHGCDRTLATGLGVGESAVAIATAHRRRSAGLHIAIDPTQTSVFGGEGLRQLGAAGLLQYVQHIEKVPEVALPELLRDETEVDFGFILGPKSFEEAFLEFLYLDRMLTIGGIIAVSGVGAAEASALVEFIAQARAYEPRSTPGSAMPVLRKLGRQHARESPFPSRWRRSGADRSPQPGPRPTDFDTAPSGGPAPSPAGGVPLRSAATRELYLARARATELETRAYELGARLVDAELRAAREMSELHGELELSRAAHERAEYWLARVNSSVSWRVTAPLRWASRLVRALRGR